MSLKTEGPGELSQGPETDATDAESSTSSVDDAVRQRRHATVYDAVAGIYAHLTLRFTPLLTIIQARSRIETIGMRARAQKVVQVVHRPSSNTPPRMSLLDQMKYFSAARTLQNATRSMTSIIQTRGISPMAAEGCYLTVTS